MKRPKRIVLSFAAAALGLAILPLFVFRTTLTGLALQHLVWKEDAYRGAALSDLANSLEEDGRSLEVLNPTSYYGRTGQKLQANQRALRFPKGSRYQWFRGGTARNYGYVLVEKSGDIERIVSIVHARYVDSL